MTESLQPIQHETYRMVDIRSHPCEVTRQNEKKWKIRLDITFPTGGFTATAPEYLDEMNFFSTLNKAHTAGSGGVITSLTNGYGPAIFLHHG